MCTRIIEPFYLIIEPFYLIISSLFAQEELGVRPVALAGSYGEITEAELAAAPRVSTSGAFNTFRIDAAGVTQWVVSHSSAEGCFEAALPLTTRSNMNAHCVCHHSDNTCASFREFASHCRSGAAGMEHHSAGAGAGCCRHSGLQQAAGDRGSH